MPRLSKIGAAALAAFGWTGGQTVSASYLQVAGGGGGGFVSGGNRGAGGGAGGLLTGTASLNPTLSYTVTVGAGGTPLANGSNSTITGTGISITASVGGGAGGSQNGASSVVGQNGGSGGGGPSQSGTGSNAAGTGTSGQGNDGAAGTNSGGQPFGCGGGGGAGAVGTLSNNPAGAGGVGLTSSITGTSTYYAGGGGGGTYAAGPGVGGAGGLGGGGTGGGSGGNSTSGTANLGGGGGGAEYAQTSGSSGGSGVVIISYVGAQQFGGGVVTSSGGNTIHTFTTSGTLSPLSSLTASCLVVAGGGGGGGGLNSSGVGAGGGGGAGGFRTGSSITIDTNSIYVVTVGGGGNGALSSGVVDATNGSNSVFFSVTSAGGGKGGSYDNGGLFTQGGNGGSGGGNGYANVTTAGQGNTPSTSPSQGNNGGLHAGGGAAPAYGCGGGGGAGAVGSAGTTSAGGNGGTGTASSISGSSVTYAGGGGGGADSGGSAGTGGSGGGGNGSNSTDGSAGTANLGGGGGGGGNGSGSTTSNGGAGGSGVVIISYAGSTQLMAGGTVTVAGGNVIHTFTSSGYLTPIVLVNNSLRFRSSASAYLNRTATQTGNTQKMTLSAWVKYSTSTTYSVLYSAQGTGGTDQDAIYIDNTTQQLVMRIDAMGGTNPIFYTNMVFRDPAAWYHIVVAIDTTQATSTNRAIVYVNGVQQTLASYNAPTQNINTTGWNVAGRLQFVGTQAQSYPAFTWNGYITELNWIDGQQLTANSFGTSNGLGIWQPIRYGGSYGTNGFYLPFNGSSNSTFAGSFNGSNQSLSVPASSQFSFSGDFTWEAWVLLNSLPTGGGAASIITSRGAVASDSAFQFLITESSGNIRMGATVSISSTDYDTFTSASLNLPIKTGTWNHYAVVRSGTTVTCYLNGINVGTTTGVSGTTNTPTYVPTIGVRGSGGYNDLYLNGYISNLRMVGSAVYTANFTPPTSALTAISGTRLLTLQNSTIIDNSTNSFTITNNNSVTTSTQYPYVVTAFLDQGPAGNNWTPNNISGINGSSYDFMTDVPTLTSATAANYAVLNPTVPKTYCTQTDGNLKSAGTSSTDSDTSVATIGVSSGKWYWEDKIGTISSAVYPILGAGRNILSSFIGKYPGDSSVGGLGIVVGNGNIVREGSIVTTVTALVANDVVGFALDLGALTCAIYKNNSLIYTVTGLTAGTYYPMANEYSSSNSTHNYGQQPFAYTPPTGFLQLNTFNLPTPTIGATASTTANKYFDASLYTGNGASSSNTTQNITTNFYPDLTWVKGRDSAFYHRLTSTGLTQPNYLSTNSTDAEDSLNDQISALASTYFQVKAAGSGGTNQSGLLYVGWAWNANSGSTVTNTNGSIISSVSANTTSGFSILTYTGNATSSSTVGHGLGTTPTFFIIKSRGVQVWNVYSLAGGITGNTVLELNSTAAANTGSNISLTASSTTIGFGSASQVNGSGVNFVAYCFAPIAGYSAFGSYTGNGSTDGPFIFTGFRPRFVMIKRTDAVQSWWITDTARNPSNTCNLDLFANLANAEENNGYNLDLLSNGVKIRTSTNDRNASSGTYIYMAFAESPFKYANARQELICLLDKTKPDLMTATTG